MQRRPTGIQTCAVCVYFLKFFFLLSYFGISFRYLRDVGVEVGKWVGGGLSEAAEVPADAADVFKRF